MTVESLQAALLESELARDSAARLLHEAHVDLAAARADAAAWKQAFDDLGASIRPRLLESYASGQRDAQKVTAA